MIYKNQLTRDQALQKLKHYCSYQERCHSEVRDKLFQLKARKADHDDIIATLIEERYLNEERFAIAFASGKFKIKQWGRIKIKFELKQRKVSDYCINKAIKNIEEDEYRKVLKQLALDKHGLLKGEQSLARKKKTIDYLLEKGYEFDLVKEAVGDLSQS